MLGVILLLKRRGKPQDLIGAVGGLRKEGEATFPRDLEMR
jgi:hypothetical protein